MEQPNFSDIEYSNRKKTTKRERFLDYMNENIDWDYWSDEVRPHYYAGKRGRKPKNIELMLRMYLLKEWYGLSYSDLEDAIYDSYAMRKFMQIDFFTEQVPAISTLRRFVKLMEREGIGKRLLAETDLTKKEAGF